MKKSLFFAGFLLTVISCSKTENQEALKIDSQLMRVVSEKSVSSDITDQPQNTDSSKERAKKIIKNGDIGLAVSDVNKAKSKVAEIVKKNDAYIQNEKFRNSETSDDLDLLIRIPKQNFDTVLNSFSSGIGALEFKNITADDVTEEYTNVEIKLENKKIYLEKYRDFLKQAGSTKDMLEIQEKIRGLEDEIDVSEGRLRFIDDRVNYSTLNLTLHKDKPATSITSKLGFGNRFIDSVSDGWNIFVSFILGLISLWPFLLLIPFLIFGFRKWKRRAKKQA